MKSFYNLSLSRIHRFYNLSLILVLVFLLAPTFSSADAATRIAILGDRTGGANQEVFESIVNEVVLLHPDMVLTVGDLIEGPQPDLAAINNEWDVVLQSLSPLRCPIYHVAGNNDIFDEVSRKAFTERTGFQSEYSFDFNNIHFVVLDNSQMRNWNSMSEERLLWLGKDLEASQNADMRIVVFHKPFWLESMQRGAQSKLHQIFLEHNVNIVFSGHHHRYTATETDGIKYIMIGSSGGHHGPNKYRGEDYHYGFLTIDENETRFAMLEAGHIKPWNWLTYDDRILQEKIDTELMSISRPVLLPGSKRCAIQVELNSDCGVTRCNYRWKTEGTSWTVSCQNGEFSLDKGNLIQDFSALIGKNWYPLPELELDMVLGDTTYETSQTLAPLIQANLGVFKEKIVICDGKLDDPAWLSEQSVTLHQFCSGNGGELPTDPLKIQAVICGDRLYISSIATVTEPLPEKSKYETVKDGPVFMDDCVYLVFWSEDSPSMITQVVVNCYGVILDQQGPITERSPYYRPQMDPKWNADLDFGNTVMENSWCFELSIPLTDLGITSTHEKLLFNALRFQPSRNNMAVWQAPATFYPEDAGKLMIIR